MRIVWLSHFVPYPPRGGAWQRTHHLLRLASIRHEVHLLALNRGATRRRTAEDLEEARRALGSVAASVQFFSVPAARSRTRYALTAALAFFRKAPFDVSWLKSPDLRRHLEASTFPPFDLVHVDTLGLWPLTLPNATVPCVLNHHNVESHMMARRAALERRGLQRFYFQREASKLARMERLVCPRVGQNLVVSDLDRERLTATVGPVRIAVVPNGVDTTYFQPVDRFEPEPKHLLFVGGMSWYPNRRAVRFLVQEIWPQLTADDPNWKLTLVGRDPSAEVLGWAARDPRIRVTGFVEDARPLFEEAAIYVCPIMDGGGTRLKVLDALAMAKPLVATQLAVEGLGLDEGRHYVRAETTPEFVRSIRDLAAQPEKRKQLARAARLVIRERYDWEAIGPLLEGAYQSAWRGQANSSNEPADPRVSA